MELACLLLEHTTDTAWTLLLRAFDNNNNNDLAAPLLLFEHAIK
jgi:hypothetical protein